MVHIIVKGGGFDIDCVLSNKSAESILRSIKKVRSAQVTERWETKRFSWSKPIKHKRINPNLSSGFISIKMEKV